GNELGEQACHEQDEEDPERPEAALVGAEQLPAAKVDAGHPFAAPRLGGGDRPHRSDLPRLEIDAGIDQRVDDVAPEVGEKAEEPQNREGREAPRKAPAVGGAPPEKTDPVKEEEGLEGERAGEEGPDKGAGKAGDDNDQAMAKDRPKKHPPLAQALGARRH